MKLFCSNIIILLQYLNPECDALRRLNIDEGNMEMSLV